jgi:hypothetical protein
MEAALQRTDALDPQCLQLLCRPGTAGFVGSSTVEHDLLILGQHGSPAGELIG